MKLQRNFKILATLKQEARSKELMSWCEEIGQYLCPVVAVLQDKWVGIEKETMSYGSLQRKWCIKISPDQRSKKKNIASEIFHQLAAAHHLFIPNKFMW